MPTPRQELQHYINRYLRENPGSEQQLADELSVSKLFIALWAKGKHLPSSVEAKQRIGHLKPLLSKLAPIRPR